MIIMIFLYKYIISGELRGKGYYINDIKSISKGLFYLKKSVLSQFPNEKIEVFKDDNGKPYVDRNNTYVSVSHTENIVICGISDEPIGIDVETVRDKLNVNRIAARYFTAEENKKIEADGKSVFYEIWCRKEAYSKLIGKGLSYGIKKISTVKKSNINEEKNIFSEEIDGVPIRGQWIKEGYFAYAGGRGEIKWIEVQD